MYEDLIVDVCEPIAWVTINRPHKLNTLRIRTLEEITDVVRALGDNRAARVIVITGAGDRAFSAGIYVNEMAEMDALACRDFTRLESAAYRAVLFMEKPCIAAVNGYALGGGCVLAMAADIRIASESAVFGLTELNMGAPVPIEGALLPLLVGHGRAREIIYTARHVDAVEAQAIGLCSRVVPKDKLREAAESLALQIAKHDGAALRGQKEIMNKWLCTDFVTAVDYSINATSVVFSSGAPKRAIAEFLNKRNR